MFDALPLAIGFFAGTLAGIALMALAAAGELRPKPAKVETDPR